MPETINMMEEALKNNVIPEEVADRYKIRPCVVTYEVTDEVKQKCIDFIDCTIAMWEDLPDEECKASHREFTRTQKNGKVVQDTYYCGCLCSCKDKCEHYQDFKNTWQADREEEELF